MLKLNYPDYGLFLEQVTASLDAVTTQRVMLAVCSGDALHVEPGQASFLVATEIPELHALQSLLSQDLSQQIMITPVDHEFVEVSLKGTWLASSVDADTGMFITVLVPHYESWLYQLWEVTQSPTMLLR